MYFDEQIIDSLRLCVLQGPFATDGGTYSLRVEMNELWSSDEKLTTRKEVTIEYVPLKRRTDW